MKIRELRKLIKKNEVQISSNDIMRCLQNSYINPNNIRQPIGMRDSQYWTVDEDTWRAILKYSRIDKRKYVPERMDCDKFARMLWAEMPWRFGLNAIAMAGDPSISHAYNIVVCADKKGKMCLAMVEPQTDDLVKVGRTRLENFPLEPRGRYKASINF